MDYTECIVEYRRDGTDGHFFTMTEEGIPVFHIDLKELSPDGRRHWANRLLNAAVLSCVATTLASDLTKRGATVKSMTGRAASELEKDDYQRTKIAHIQVEIDVDIGDTDPRILEECREIIGRDTLTMYSLREGVEVDAVINRVGSG